MAIEQSRVVARFKSKFANVAISKQKLEAIAAKFASKLPDEAEDEAIDAELDFYNEVNPFLEIAKAEHREAQQKLKDKQASESQNQQQSQNSQQQQTTTPPENSGDMAELVKALLEQNKAILGELGAIKGEKTQQTIQQRIQELAGTDLPKEWIQGKQAPQNLEDVEGWVTAEKEAYQSFVQKNFNQSVSGTPPRFGDAKNPKKEATAQELDAVMKNLDLPLPKQ